MEIDSVTVGNDRIIAHVPVVVRMVEFDAVPSVILNVVVINEMTVRVIEEDACIAIRNDVVCYDRVGMIY